MSTHGNIWLLGKWNMFEGGILATERSFRRVHQTKFNQRQESWLNHRKNKLLNTRT